jgi:pyruvate dehydrogenase E1 component alpha subunit
MAKVKLTAKDAKKLYQDMLTIRKLEEKSASLYGMGLIAGFCHLYIGQEAVVTGLHFLSEPQDSLITGYRDHAHMVVSGMESKRILAELTGRETGYSKGKGGSMHMFSQETKFYGGHGIVGAQASLGTGLAFAHNYNKDNGINFTYFGDGAINQGQISESFNMAALWSLPIIYVLENNQYSMGMSNQRSTSNTNYSLRAEAFGIKSAKVDGMNILDVIEKGKEAVDYVRSGKGPYFLEVWTYRYRGHSMSDPAKYRTREELDKIKDNRDPIETFVNYAISNKLLKETEIKSIQTEVKKMMDEAEEYATTSNEPAAHELYTDILI